MDGWKRPVAAPTRADIDDGGDPQKNGLGLGYVDQKTNTRP